MFCFWCFSAFSRFGRVFITITTETTTITAIAPKISHWMLKLDLPEPESVEVDMDVGVEDCPDCELSELVELEYTDALGGILEEQVHLAV